MKREQVKKIIHKWREKNAEELAKITLDYAHDFRDMRMSQEELVKVFMEYYYEITSWTYNK